MDGGNGIPFDEASFYAEEIDPTSPYYVPDTLGNGVSFVFPPDVHAHSTGYYPDFGPVLDAPVPSVFSENVSCLLTIILKSS
jgi:hypothetical protein